jgi:chromosome segregation ATPase
MSEFLSSNDFEKFNKQNDARFGAFGVRIAEFQSIREENKALKDSLVAANTKIDNLTSTLVSHAEATGKALAAHKDSDALVAQKIGDLSASIASLSNAHAQTRAYVSAIESAHSHTSDTVSQQNAKLDTLPAIRADLSVSKMDIVGIKETASKQASNAASEIQKIAARIHELVSAISSLQAFKDQYAKDKQEISSAQKKLSDDIVLSRQNATDHIVTQCQSLTNNMSEKIAAIKIPDIKNVFPESRIAKIEAQLESIALDAKNAFLKSSNVDMQSQLHSKKIENIQLLLKQHELTK